MILENICKERGLPAIWDGSGKWNDRRKEILDILQQEEYGFGPGVPEQLAFEVLQEERNFCAGKVTLSKVQITAKCQKREFSFPIYTSIPHTEGRHPFFVHVNFRDCIPDRYLPIEEICDRGFAVISIYYQDVTPDAWPEGEDNTDGPWGKIALWAWAASRAMDYAMTLECLDHAKAAVIGHSRLGKTALVAGALDERFSYVISNDSGCSGAALSRGKQGESVARILTRYGYWFCDAYKKYAGQEEALPFDQHFLIGASAPRKVYVASAIEDTWADPCSEYLSCFAASAVYEKLGLQGLVCPDRLPQAGDVFQEGCIGYHLRTGTHYLGREDWKYFMDFLER